MAKMNLKLKHKLSFGRSTSGNSSVASDTSSHDSHHSDDSSHLSSSNQSTGSTHKDRALPPPVLVYHESARSIVFRDHVRRVCDVAEEQAASTLKNGATRHASFMTERASPIEAPSIKPHRRTLSECYVHEDPSFSSELNEMSNLFGGPDSMRDSVRSSHSVEIQGFQPHIVPLPQLRLGKTDAFEPLIESPEGTQEEFWTDAEKEVYRMLENQRAVIKTIKNSEWTSFLHRFKSPQELNGKYPDIHNDIGPHGDGDYPFNSFVTSTSLLPPNGKKMRGYGAPATYATGVVFALPSFENDQAEDEAAKQTKTWSWPSGYSAKTEFNINGRGELINGRAEAIVPLSMLRQYNKDYVDKSDYIVAGRLLKGGLKTVPYNEVFVRVGGKGRLDSNGKLLDASERSFQYGVGLPIALFVRTATFGHLISLLRIRARLMHIFGEKHITGLPLILISPELGTRILTESLQHKLLKVAARQLNPFQNSMIAHKTKMNETDPDCMEIKLEELLDLDDKIRETLTPDELARIAGGFGCTDDSIAAVLRDAMIQDKKHQEDGGLEEAHELQDIVNEGLAASVRASDFYTSRQLLILYSLVASEGHQIDAAETIVDDDGSKNCERNDRHIVRRKSSLDSEAMLVRHTKEGKPMTLSDVKRSLPPPPPPPPLDTDRLRSATNSDGLLAVLGAAQILKTMQDGSAKKRTEESFIAVEEWVQQGEQNMAFRLASWRDQRAAQDDLAIAVDRDSSFMAFVSNKAISNRKRFASQLREAVEQTDFNNVRFLTAIYDVLESMHSPCLRLELLQYVLGLDNRYSIAHVKRAVELAATCLSISCSAEPRDEDIDRSRIETQR